MLSERKAFLLGYAWGTLEKALGSDYDPDGSKYEYGAAHPLPAFYQAHAAAQQSHALTNEIKDILTEVIGKIDPDDLSDTEELSPERQVPWQMGVYKARSGEPLKFDIAAARSRKGWTQAQLAEKLGLPTGQVMVSRWESGKVEPSKRTWEKLRKILQ